MAVRACLDRDGHPAGLRPVREDLLGALHIELDSFRIAGGIMLF
jgi:multiple antibiotic resistance protein